MSKKQKKEEEVTERTNSGPKNESDMERLLRQQAYAAYIQHFQMLNFYNYGMCHPVPPFNAFNNYQSMLLQPPFKLNDDKILSKFMSDQTFNKNDKDA